jgi:hypothetical protein
MLASIELKKCENRDDLDFFTNERLPEHVQGFQTQALVSGNFFLPRYYIYTTSKGSWFIHHFVDKLS